MNNKVFDVIGIGFGPANIALAIAMEESDFQGKVKYFECNSGPSWQPQMLLPGSDIQNNPLKDLVTPRNPRSRYSFTNFLFENDRLFEHLNLGLEFPLRREFAEYVKWVARFFDDLVHYNATVVNITYHDSTKRFEVQLQNGDVYFTSSVVVAPGRTPRIPQAFQKQPADRVFHLTQYEQRIQYITEQETPESFVVVGGSQSAIEIMLDLQRRFPTANIHNLQRGYGFRLKDTSHFSEHVYFPSFVDYYFDSSKSVKERINKHLHYTNYSAADGDVIHELYVKMYEEKLEGKQRTKIHAFSQVDSVRADNDRMCVTLKEVNTGARSELTGVSAVILATGFRDLGTKTQDELCPPILERLYDHIDCDEEGVIQISRDYQLKKKQGHELGPLFLNGLCESSHGYGDAGSFSLLAYRSKEILDAIVATTSAVATKSVNELEAV